MVDRLREVLVLLYLSAVINDIVAIRTLAVLGDDAIGRTDASVVSWMVVLAMSMAFSWRACALYTATRPVLSWRSVVALCLPGAAHLLVEISVPAVRSADNDGDIAPRVEQLQQLYDAALLEASEATKQVASSSTIGASRRHSPAPSDYSELEISVANDAGCATRSGAISPPASPPVAETTDTEASSCITYAPLFDENVSEATVSGPVLVVGAVRDIEAAGIRQSPAEGIPAQPRRAGFLSGRAASFMPGRSSRNPIGILSGRSSPLRGGAGILSGRRLQRGAKAPRDSSPPQARSGSRASPDEAQARNPFFGRVRFRRTPSQNAKSSTPVRHTGNELTKQSHCAKEVNASPIQLALAELSCSKIQQSEGRALVLKSEDYQPSMDSSSAHGGLAAYIRGMLEAHAATSARLTWPLSLLSFLWLEIKLVILSVMLTPSQLWRAGLVLLFLEDTQGHGGIQPEVVGTSTSSMNLREESRASSEAENSRSEGARVDMVRGCRKLLMFATIIQCLPQLLLRTCYVASTGLNQAVVDADTHADGSPRLFGLSSATVSPFSIPSFLISTALSLGACLLVMHHLATEHVLHSMPLDTATARPALVKRVNDLSEQQPSVSAPVLLDALCKALDGGVSARKLIDATHTLLALRVSCIRELKSNGCSAEMCLKAGANLIELRRAEYGAVALVNAAHVCSSNMVSSSGTAPKLGAAELRRAGFSLLDLRSTGSFDQSELRDAGFKAEEMKDASVNQLRDMGYSVAEILAVPGLDEHLGEFRRAGFSASEMKNAGYDAERLLHAGYAASELKFAGFSADVLHRAGVNAEVMASLFTIFELKEAKYPPKSLRQCHSKFTISNLRDAGYTMTELEDAGYPTSELRAVEHAEQRDLYSWDELIEAIVEVKHGGVSASHMRQIGFSCAELKAGDYTLSELKAAGYGAVALYKEAAFPLNKLRIAGITAKELRENGAQLAELHAAGFSAMQLKQAGYTLEEMARRATAGQLRTAEFSAQELKDVGFSLAQLKTAGFPAEQVSQLGSTAFELLGAGFKPDELDMGSFSDDSFPVVSPPREKRARKSKDELDAMSGKSPEEMIAAGLSMLEIKAAGVTASQLRALGLGVSKLKQGYSPMQMREAGFTAIELKLGGIPPSRFKKAGYSEAEIKDAILIPRRASAEGSPPLSPQAQRRTAAAPAAASASSPGTTPTESPGVSPVASPELQRRFGSHDA